MPVQLHYYGTRLDLDPTQTDEYWKSHIDNELARVRESGNAAMAVRLADRTIAHVYINGDSPIILTTTP